MSNPQVHNTESGNTREHKGTLESTVEFETIQRCYAGCYMPVTGNGWNVISLLYTEKAEKIFWNDFYLISALKVTQLAERGSTAQCQVSLHCHPGIAANSIKACVSRAHRSLISIPKSWEIYRVCI